MESQKIERLIKKYESGQTSLAEERSLREYFESGRVPAHLESYRLLFAYSANKRKEEFTGKMPVLPEKRNKGHWWAIAAGIAILLGVFLFQGNPEGTHTPMADVENNEAAVEETLKMFSEILKDSREDMAYLAEFSKTTNKYIKDH